MQSSISETFGVSFITDEMLENKYKETGIIVCNHSDIGVANVEYKDSINVLTKDFKKDMKIPIHKAATSLFSEYDNLNERFLRSNMWAMTPLLANISIAEKRSLHGIFARDRSFASAHQYFWCSVPYSSQYGNCYSQVFP